MFARLFARSGLSLDRLRALVEVGACGSIVRAAQADPARQSQYSRQIKELEDFFEVPLLERHGKGVRLTAQGTELARISRFFLLGLSNFQRGCVAEDQVYRIGADATFISCFLLPVVSATIQTRPGIRFRIETVRADDAERRLQDLTLDFAVVTRTALSRPLQSRELGSWRLRLWAPRSLCKTAQVAVQAFRAQSLPIALPVGELSASQFEILREYEPALACENFLEAKAALAQRGVAALLPDFLNPTSTLSLLNPKIAELEAGVFRYSLAWNPRLLRLNPHAGRRRDALVQGLSRRFSSAKP